METTNWARFHAEIKNISNMSWEEIAQQAEKERRINEIESLIALLLGQLDNILNTFPTATLWDSAALRQDIRRLQGLRADALKEVGR